MTFEKWLKEQVGRNDVVGDLAQDFISSKQKKCDAEHLRLMRACPEAFSALKKARQEFKKFAAVNE